MRRIGVLLVVFGCSGGGGGATTELSHDNPGFKAKVPADLKVGKDKPSDTGGSLSIANADMSEEVFFIWSKSGSDTDPVPQFGRHKEHKDLVKVIEEKDLPGGGKFIQIDRGARIFSHSVLATGGFGIECTVSWASAKPARPELAEACKTLAPK
jgi:hypothetical protein